MPVKHQQLVVAVGHLGEQQRRAGLGHGFHNQHARHDRVSGEMSHEKLLVDGDVLDGDDALGAHQLNYAIDQKQRVTMRQKFENSANVDCFGNGINLVAHCGIVKSKIIHIVDKEIVIPIAPVTSHP